MANISNFIPINRKIFEHRFWCEDREYSRFEAWIDLIQSARFEDGKKYIGNKVMKLKRGQIHASIRFLSERWGWSTKRVLGFLELLNSDDMISKETHKETGHTVLTICNYDTYNTNITARKQDGNGKETGWKRQGNETNKENNYKNEEYSTPHTPQGVGSADEVVSDEIEVEADDGKRKKVAPKKEKPEPPAIEEFVEYGLANITGVTSYRSDLWESVLRRKYTAWMESGWRTGGKKPKPIQVWKTTLLNSLPYLERDVSVMIQSQPAVSKLEHNLAVGARVWGIN